MGCQVLHTLSPATSLTSCSLPAPLPTSLQLHWPSCLSLNMPGMPLPQDFCTCSYLCLEEFPPGSRMNCFLISLRALLRSHLLSERPSQATLKWNSSSPPWHSILLTAPYLSLWHLPPSAVLNIYWFIVCLSSPYTMGAGTMFCSLVWPLGTW